MTTEVKRLPCPANRLPIKRSEAKQCHAELMDLELQAINPTTLQIVGSVDLAETDSFYDVVNDFEYDYPKCFHRYLVKV